MKRRTLAQIYGSIPKVACTGACWRSCGPIPMSRLELERVRAAAFGPTPTAPDSTLMVSDDSLTCPQLDALRRCSVYQARPTICRLFGVAEGMPCPHGCEPERVVSNEEARRLLAEALEAGR